MHRLYVTEGVVLGKRGIGEANTFLSLLTRELGLIRASARSTRAEQSKLRFGLEPLSSGRYTFVRGRHEWKLVGAEEISHEFASGDIARRRAAGRVARLLLRLIHGEEPTSGLFPTVTEGLSMLVQATTTADVEMTECILVLRVLAELGYVPNNQNLAPFVASTQFPPEMLAEAASKRPFLIRTINESLSATGL